MNINGSLKIKPGGLKITPYTAPYQYNINYITSSTSGYIIYDASYPITPLLLNGEVNNPTWLSDASTQTNVLTTSGNVVSSKFSPVGPLGFYSYQFNGTTDYVSTVTSTIGTNDFTVEYWYYALGTCTAIWNGAPTSGGTYGMLMQVNAPTVTLSLGNGSAWTISSQVITSSTFYQNTWTHHALVRTGGIFSFYQNGQPLFTTPLLNGVSIANQYLQIGAQSRNTSWFNGYISNFRIVNGTALYNPLYPFVPSNRPLQAVANTAILTANGPRFYDFNSNLPLVPTGTPKVSYVQPFGTAGQVNLNNGYYSNYFLGTGTSNLSITSAGIPQLSSNSFTIECWFNVDRNPNVTGGGNASSIFSTFNSAYNSGFLIYLLGTTAGYLAITVVTGGGSPSNISLSPTLGIVSNTWYHLALTRSTAGVFNLYLNGSLVGSTTNASTWTDNVYNISYCAPATHVYPFPGYISNFRIVTGTVVYNGNFIPPTSPLTAIPGTVLLTCLNSTFTDSSSLNNSITSNSVTVDYSSPFAAYSTATTVGSASFDGASGYITAPHNPAMDFGTGDFTIECWAYFNSFPTYSPLVTRWSTNLQWYVAVWGSTSVHFISKNSGVSTIGNFTFVVGQWYHIAVTRASNTVRIFVNGGQTVAGTDATNISTAASILTIGVTGSAALTQLTNGYISEVRVVAGTALYTGNFTPSTQSLTVVPGTVLLTLQNRQNHKNNLFVDDSPHNAVATMVGSVTQGTFSPFSRNGWSNYFDGSTGYLIVSANAPFTFGTNNHTIECWFYITGTLPTYSCLWSYSGSGASGTVTNNYYFTVPSSTLLLGNGSGAFGVNITSATPSSNTWHHHATVRSGNTFTVYLDGVAVSTTTYSGSVTAQAAGFSIGSYGSTAATFFPGYVTDFRVTNGTALYTSAFTPPSQMLSPVTNTVLLTAQSNYFVDTSTITNTVTSVGTVMVMPESPYLTTSSYSATLLGGSMYFPGSSYLSFPSNAAFAVPVGGAFTLEMWIYWTGSYATTTRLFSFYTGGIILYPNTSGNMIYGIYGSTTYITSSKTIPLNSWLHVAVVRASVTNGGGAVNTNMYFNGVSVGSSTTDTGGYNQAGAYIGTDNGTNFWTGYIANLRFIRGKALYVTSFAVPTTPPVAIGGVGVYNTTTFQTSLLLLGNNAGIVDQTGRNNLTTVGTATSLITGTGNPLVKYGSGSMYFSGSSSLTIPATPFYAFGGPFTVEMWVYPTANIPAFAKLFFGGSSGTPLCIDVQTTGLTLTVNNNSTVLLTSSIALNLNAWNHVAVSRSSTTMYLFINGQVGASAADSTNFTSAGTVSIGTNGTAYFSGYIDDLRVTNGFGRYTTNFTPPTQTFPTQAESSSSSSTFNISTVFNYPANYLVVAGGGGGGFADAGGGGAGGLLSGVTLLTSGTAYAIVVGAGGAGGVAPSTAATGSNSSFVGSIVALGGGLGSSYNINSGAGGSGGGGSNGANGSSGTPGQGNGGGNSGGSFAGGGGGGGAASTGSNGSGQLGGAGGNGTFTNLISTTLAITAGVGQYITATNAIYFAGGGGGGGGNACSASSGAVGGYGGGGAGGYSGPSTWTGLAGQARSGGGGGGGGGQSGVGNGNGANGGSGVVMVSIPTTAWKGTQTGASSVVINGANTVVIFTASGTLTA